MGTLQTFFDNTLSIERQSAVSGARYTSAITVASGVQCVTPQPVRDQTQLYNQANWGKEHWTYIDAGVDIRPNDNVVIQGQRYGVLGVSEWVDQFQGSDMHIKVVITKK